MKKESLKGLKKEFNEIYDRIKTWDDPADKIKILEPFIKKILETAGREELLLACPLGPECRLSDYETDGNSWGEVIQDFIEHFYSPGSRTCNTSISGNVEIELENDEEELLEWLEPAWVAFVDFPNSFEETGLTLYFSDYPDRKILVRLGIVKGRIKYTHQFCKFNDDDELIRIYPETQWRSLRNIMDADFWMQLIVILLTKQDVWEYNDKYPILLKSNHPSVDAEVAKDKCDKVEKENQCYSQKDVSWDSEWPTDLSYQWQDE